MPEIGEVARIVNRLRTHLAGKIIRNVHAVEDALVFKDTTSAEFVKCMTGKKVVDARQWGKYFWLVMDSPPHPVMHFGMTGWIYIKNDPAAHYRSAEVSTDWPPRFMRFTFELDDGNEIAFADQRRLGRIRLLNEKDGNNIRNVAPISENGPDPVQEQIQEDWLFAKLRKKAVPIKTFLLDQAILAGIGNWVADEILFNARLHPETVTNTLSDDQMRALHNSINYVTKIAVETEGETERFPKDWLMLHRWNKGKKDEDGAGRLPTGEKVEFITVGGRNSAYVPALQKKGVKDMSTNGEAKDIEKKAVRKTSKKVAKDEEHAEKQEEEVEDETVAKKQASRGRPKKVAKDEGHAEKQEEKVEDETAVKKQASRRRPKKVAKDKEHAEKQEEEVEDETVAKKQASRRRPKKVAKDEGHAEKQEEGVEDETVAKKQASRGRPKKSAPEGSSKKESAASKKRKNTDNMGGESKQSDEPFAVKKGKTTAQPKVEATGSRRSTRLQARKG